MAKRPDVNAVALDAIRTLLAAPLPPTVQIGSDVWTLTAKRAAPTDYWPDIDIAKSEHGPWPSELVIEAKNGTNTTHLRLGADIFTWEKAGPTATAVSLRLGDRQNSRISTSTFAFLFWGQPDGTYPVRFWNALFTRKGETKDATRRLTAHFREAAKQAGLPVTPTYLELGSVTIPSAEWTPDPAAVLSLVIRWGIVRDPYSRRRVTLGDTPVKDEAAPTKHQSIHPFPGGQSQYLTSLRELLGWLAEFEHGMTDKDLRAKMKEEWGVANDTYYGVTVRLPIRIGFATRDGGIWQITAAGQAWQKEPDADAVFQSLHQHHEGLLALLVVIEALDTGKGVAIADQNETLQELLGVKWQVELSTVTRRNWLWSLGYVEHEGTGDKLTEAGRAALMRFGEEAAAYRADLEAESEEALGDSDPAEAGDATVSAESAQSLLAQLDAGKLAIALESNGIRIKRRLLDMACASIRAGKHLLLVGPPGTGKTELSIAIAQAARELGACTGHKVSTASADWTTFDTIGGYALEPTDAGSRLAFRPGVFLSALDQQKWLIIDELNRADIDKAFGELMTVLSGKSAEPPYRDADGRPISIDVSAVVAKHKENRVFHVWPDFRVLASMNTWDKSSLFRLSFAVQRRFAVLYIDVPNDADFVAILKREAEQTQLGAVAAKQVDALLGLFQVSSLLQWRPVGPAIARDMVAYCRERNAPGAIAEAIETLLLPQLENLEDHQRKLVAQLMRTVASSDGSSADPDFVARLNEAFGHDGL